MDLTTMEQAHKWGRFVTVKHDGEEVSYKEYVGQIKQDLVLEDLQVPSGSHRGVKELASDMEHSHETVSKRISLLLLPEKGHQWIETGDLTQTDAVKIINKCRSQVEEPQKALEMIGNM